ncbi:hypothetical protein [Bradyrhizobium sp. USDA 4451]
MGNITMRQVIVDARGHENIVVRDDGRNSSCEVTGSRVKSGPAPSAPRTMRRAVPVWFATTLAAMCLSDPPGSGSAQAQSNGVAASSPQLAQAKAKPAGDAGKAKEQSQAADALARELVAAQKEIESLQGLLTKERENSTRVENDLRSEADKLRKSLQDMPQGSTADLQKALGQEHERAVQLEQNLAAARRDVEAQSAAAAKASDELAKLRPATEELRRSMQRERERGDVLAQDLSTARNKVYTYEAQATKASAEAARLKVAPQGGVADLQKSLVQERERAAGLEKDLAAARRAVEAQTALATKASDEAARLRATSQNGAADLQKSLVQERERTAGLEKDLAAARRAVEAQTALATKASDEAARLRATSQNGAADLQRSMEKERERAAGLEKDLAAARRNVETQTALAAKASDEAARLKKASESGAADLQRSLAQERERAAGLEKDLAAARRNVETQTALAAKASDEAARLKKASENGAADLQSSMEKERERAAGLEKDLAAARRNVETQTALAAKASDEAARLKKASESGATDLQKSLAQERERAAGLEKDLAAARRDVETQTALAAKAGDEATRLKGTSQSGAADLQKSLAEEHERATRLEQDLAAARREVETQAALAAKAGDEADRLKKASENGAADLQKSLAEEHERAARLELDLAAARRDMEAQSAATAKASDELAKLRLATDAGAADQRQSMQKEHERSDALAQDLATARSKIYAYEAQAAKARDEAVQHQQAEPSDTAELRQSLQREQQRAEQLARDLAAKSRELDTQAEQAAAANAQAATAQQAAEQSVAELRSLLQSERGRAEQLERDLASARRDVSAPAAKVPPVASQVATTGSVGKSMQDEPAGAAVGSIEDRAAAPRTAGNAVVPPDDGAQEARLMARARLLLEQGDIGAARIVLERVAETGSAQASFALAETYDPQTLTSWGTYGTRGDAAKARDLYAKAEAGGIKEAKARFEALR